MSSSHTDRASATRGSTVIPILVGLLALAPFLPLIAPDDRVIPDGPYCDYGSYQLPVREFARSEFRNRRFPLWIPHLAGGLPLHAGQQAALCDPLLSPLLLVYSANRAIRLSLFLHLALGYVGMVWLARALGRSAWAASFAGLVATQSAFVAAHLMAGHVNLVLASGLAPWFFLCLVRLLQSPGSQAAAALAVVTALLALTGHPQLPYGIVLFGGFWWCGSLLGGDGRRHPGRCLAWTAVAGGLAVLMAAVQWLPFLELLGSNSSTAGRGRLDFAGTYALDGFDLVRLLSPHLLGNPGAGIPEFEPLSFLHEKTAYVGLATLALAAFAVTRQSADRRDAGFAALVVLGVVIALGPETPALGILGQIIPGLLYFRCPGRILGVAMLFAILLATKGMDAVVERRPMATGRRLALVVGGAWLVANLVVLLVLRRADAIDPASYRLFFESFLQSDVLASVVMAGDVCVGLWIAWRCADRRPALGSGLLVVVTAIDLYVFNVSTVRLTEDLSTRGIPAALRDTSAVRYVERPAGEPFSAARLRYGRSVPWAIASGQSVIGTNEGGVLPRSTEQLFRAIELHPAIALSASACDFDCIVASGACEPRPALARARFVRGEESHRLAIPLETLEAADLQAMHPPDRGVPVQIVSESPQRVELELTTAAPGHVVLADTFFPGWIAKVNGRVATIAPAHDVFRSVAVEAGTSRVVFEYAPASFRWGVILSLGGLAVVLGIGLSGTIHRRLVRAPRPGRASLQATSSSSSSASA